MVYGVGYLYKILNCVVLPNKPVGLLVYFIFWLIRSYLSLQILIFSLLLTIINDCFNNGFLLDT